LNESILIPVVPNSLGSGYAHRAYAESLAEFGEVVELPTCGGWLLARQAPSTEANDGMGCYPLFACRDWRAVTADLQRLADRLVCVSAVTDPFATATETQLQAAYPDVCYPYKQHFVTDLSRPLEATVAGHHRRNVRKALARLEVFEAAAGESLLSDWLPMYDNLVQRHGVRGIARFSPQSFALQMLVPGFTAFVARERGAMCGMTWWYTAGGVAYYHLAAYSDRGYALGASFALFWTALAHFAKLGLRWAALGAGAGVRAADDGLTRFKQGWATETRPAYFCGRILQPEVYARLAAAGGCPTDYFPAYRCPQRNTRAA
jgi:hypothetical protein